MHIEQAYIAHRSLALPNHRQVFASWYNRRSAYQNDQSKRHGTKCIICLLQSNACIYIYTHMLYRLCRKLLCSFIRTPHTSSPKPITPIHHPFTTSTKLLCSFPPTTFCSTQLTGQNTPAPTTHNSVASNCHAYTTPLSSPNGLANLTNSLTW